MSLRINSTGASLITGGQPNALSENTKRRLELLGINTSQIRTESEGQLILTKALESLAIDAAQKVATQASVPTVSLEDKIKAAATAIAAKTGNLDKVGFLIQKIHENIAISQASPGKGEKKVDKSADFKSSLEEQGNYYQIATASENMTGATALGYYNKMRLGLGK